MVKKAAVLAALILMIFTVAAPLGVCAGDADTASQLLGGICDIKTSGGSTQSWIDGELTDKAGTSGEWYVMALSQSGRYDLSNYQKALKTYLSGNSIASATSREKYALALICTGSNDDYITEALESSAGKQGLMSYIFALHIVNNGYTTGNITSGSLIKDILALQKADGGFAIMGDNGDPDCTAMTATALAPYYSKNSKVKSACDKALSYLSKVQGSSGAYKSFGNENCESTAQVLLALSSLGVDPCSDSRFIKGGNDLIDALQGFALPDGAFEHIKGEGANESATTQAFYCLTAYERYKNGKGYFFVFDNRVAQKKPGNADKPPVTTTVTTKATSHQKTETSAKKTTVKKTSKADTQTGSAAVTTSAVQTAGGVVTAKPVSRNSSYKGSSETDTAKPGSKPSSGKKTTTTTKQSVTEQTLSADEETETQSADTETVSQTTTVTTTQQTAEISGSETAESETKTDEDNGGIKLYIFIGIGAAAVIVCIVMFARGRRKPGSYILILAIGGVLCAVTAFLDIETKEEHFSQPDSVTASNSAGQVTMSIDCMTIIGLADNIPEDGFIIPAQTVEIKENETAYDLLDRVAKENGILIDIKGSDDMIYVSGIAGIYEFDHGELSGWMYYVNGQAPSVNSSQYKLKDGDRVEWRYTKEIGRDLDQ